MKKIHTFVVLAYKESPYLEECIKSVLNQKYKSEIVVATSTPNKFIKKIAKKYKLDVIINNGVSGIGFDFDFALECAKTELVTIAHQDDVYRNDYSLSVVNQYKKHKDALIIFTDYYEIKHNKEVHSNKNLKIKRFLSFPIRCSLFSKYRFFKRWILAFGDSICCPSVTFVKAKTGTKVFESDMKCDIDWLAWEKLSKEQGRFILISKHLMGHRVHDDSTTSQIINDNKRSIEDLYMYKKFWPNFFAQFLTKLYKNSEKSNKI